MAIFLHRRIRQIQLQHLRHQHCQRLNGQKHQKLLISANYCRNKKRPYQKPKWKRSTGTRSRQTNSWERITSGHWWQIRIRIARWPSSIGMKWKDCFASKQLAHKIHPKWAHEIHPTQLILRTEVNANRKKKIRRFVMFDLCVWIKS